MEFEFCLICEDALVDDKQRLTIFKMFDNIFANKFPAVHNKMSIVTRWKFENKDSKEKNYSQRLQITNNKKTIIDTTTEGSIPTFQENEYLQFIVNIEGLKIDNEGVYEVLVSLNDKNVHRREFKVKLITG